MRRAVEIDGIGVAIELSKATAIKSGGSSMIHFDKLSDGTWRLTYNADIIPDFSKVTALKIIRED